MNLRTVFHLLLTDVRRLRWLIAGTLLLLLWDVWPWLFGDPWSMPGRGGGYWELRQWSQVPSLLIYAGWLLAAAAGWCGIAGARVRPLRRRETFVAKLTFLTALLWLPQSAALLLVLRVNGLAWEDVLLSLAACAGVFVPLWTVALLTGRLAGSLWRWLTLAGCLIALIAFAGLFSSRWTIGMAEVLGDAWGANCGPHLWYYLGSVMAGLLLLVWLGRTWKLTARIAAVAVIFLGGAGLWHTQNWFQLTGPAVDKAALTSTLIEAVQPKPGADGISASVRTEGAQAWLEPTVAISTENLPPGVFCFWQRTGEAAVHRGGKVIAGIGPVKRRIGRPVNLSGYFPPAGTPMDDASLTAALPAGARLHINAPAWNPLARTPARLGSLEIADGVELSGSEPVSLEAKLTGILYRHELVVDAHLTKEHTVNYDGMRLSLRQVTLPKRRLPCVFVDIAVIAPAPGTGPDPLKLNWRMEPFAVWRVFLFLPASGTLIGADQSGALHRAGPLLGGASIHRRILQFDDTSRQREYSAEQLAEARVLVLAPRLLGMVQRTVRTPEAPLRLEENTTGSSDFYYTLGPYVQPRHYFDFVRPRRPDPATATEDQFGEWLRYVLPAVTLDDWKAAELSQWVPRSMETLLNIKRYTTSYDTEWGQAIALALPESRKQEIISRVPQNASLIYVLLARGWVEDARAELIQLFNSGAYLDSTGLATVASLRDPATVPAFLARLEQSGDNALYESLRLMDGIEPRLTETLRRYFARVTVRGQPPAAMPGHEDEQRFKAIETPLTHGLPEALVDALVLHRWLCSDKEPGARSYLRERMSYRINLPRGLKPRSEEARQFYFKLQPEQCRWDALTRRWITPDKL